jgi:glutamate N-acetyltransferase/amino-acid N-acetyltransferase
MSTILTLPRGFRWSAVKAGIKVSGKPDVALAVCDAGATAAAKFLSP